MGGGGSKTWVPVERPHQDLEKIGRLTDILAVKSERDHSVAIRDMGRHQNDMHNNNILKGLFHKFDPSVMKPTGQQVHGDIQLSFKYDFQSEQLLIKVIKCRELGGNTLRAKLTDTFVRLELLPDRLNQGERRTGVVVQTNNPRYDEIFSYHIPEIALGDSRLVVQVMDYALGRATDVRGEAIVSLNTFPFHSDPVHTAWYSLNLETDLSISGTLDVSVAFQIPKTLLVTVYGANNLAPRDGGQAADPFVKVAVPGCRKLFQTQVMKNTLNPVWAETFEFPIHEEEFEHRYIIFHVIDKDTKSSNDSLGQCVVELKQMDPNIGITGTFPLADLRNSERMRTKIHENRTAQEFREALVAHSFTRGPNLIFQDHQGGKIVTVTCRQAGSQGRMRLIDGIPMY